VSHRREQKERLRRERRERERAAREAARRKRLLGYAAGGALAAAALAILVLVVASGAGGGGSGSFPGGSVPERRVLDLRPAARAAGCTVRQSKDEGEQHVEGQVNYRSNPPHSGNHNQVPAEDGPYAEPVDDENLVHALEHGRVIYWFNPGASAQVKGDLKALFDEDDYHVLLAPSERRMPYQVAASAWTQVLGCKQFNDRTSDALRAFSDEFRDTGPEFVP
jgi:hypothetical protein